MLLVTGGAGFIGSNVVASLNEAGCTDIAVNDILGTGRKWRNLAARRVAEFVPAGELLRWLDGRKLDAVVHMGAISSTTENNVDLLMQNNFRLSLRLFEWCAASRTPFIQAGAFEQLASPVDIAVLGLDRLVPHVEVQGGHRRRIADPRDNQPQVRRQVKTDDTA
jgi:nucleoside-diphosphate-sugar epimerase